MIKEKELFFDCERKSSKTKKYRKIRKGNSPSAEKADQASEKADQMASGGDTGMSQKGRGRSVGAEGMSLGAIGPMGDQGAAPSRSVSQTEAALRRSFDDYPQSAEGEIFFPRRPRTRAMTAEQQDWVRGSVNGREQGSH